MHGFRIVNGFLLGIALMAPLALRADDTKTTTTTTSTRYYDSDAKDYHEWTPNEDRAYRVYLTEQYRDYFKWRHGHSDSVIIKTEEK